MIIKKGAVISNGIAIGKALVICRDKISVKGYRTQDTDTEIEVNDFINKESLEKDYDIFK